MKYLLFLPFFLFAVLYAQSDPKAFEGIIEYQISVQSKSDKSKMFKDFFAQKMTLHIKENKIRCDYDSSGVDSLRLGYLLILGDSNSVYRIMPQYQLIQRRHLSDLHETEQVFNPEIYRSLERKDRVAGMLCSMYMSEINMPMGGGKARVIVSCADQLNFPVSGHLLEQSTLMILGNGLRGIPLKKILRFEEYDFEVTMTAVAVTRQAISDEWYSLPQKYRITKFDRISIY